LFRPENQEELFRISGLAKAGGNFENFQFGDSDLGNVVLRIKNIDNSKEFAEITTGVTPEFDVITIMVLDIALSMIAVTTKSKIFTR